MLKKMHGGRPAAFAVALPLLFSAPAGAALLGDTIKPFAAVTETYDSNIFRVKDDQQLWAMVRDRQMSDFITQTTVGSRFHYGLSSLESNLLLKREFIHYSHYSSQSANRDEMGGDVSVRLLDRVKLKADGSYLREPQPRADFRSPGLNEITTLQYGLLVGYEMKSGLEFDAAYRRIGVDYSLQELKPSAYDADRYTGTVLYRLSPEAMVFASYQRENRTYRQGMRLGDAALKSDNVGDTIRVGIEKSFSPKTSVSGNIGYHKRTHDALPGRDFSGPVGKAELRYGLTPKLGVVVNGERQIYEETWRDQIYSVNNSVSAGVVYQVTEKVKATVMNRLTWKKFESLPGAGNRKDLTREVNAGVEWTPRDRLSVTVEYQYGNRSSNESGYNYSSHAVTAGVAYKF